MPPSHNIRPAARNHYCAVAPDGSRPQRPLLRLPAARREEPAPDLIGGRDEGTKKSRSRAALFLRAPRFARHHAKRRSPQKKREAERRKAQGVDTASRRQVLPLVLSVHRGAAFLFFLPLRGKIREGTARLSALYRGSCQTSRPRLGSVRSRASWQRQRDFRPVRHPGSQLLADLRRGRPGEFPNRPRQGYEPRSRAPLPLRQTAVSG